MIQALILIFGFMFLVVFLTWRYKKREMEQNSYLDEIEPLPLFRSRKQRRKETRKQRTGTVAFRKVPSVVKAPKY